jgi:adenylate cyclase
MTKERTRRKLSAILSADVKGYSRLMGENEAATVQTLKAYREVMTSFIQQHQGRVVDSPGDNLLAEFGSVVDALDCAVKIQHELKAKNKELPEKSRMEFRIGINLGDVIEDEERIYGDGVNIAARVESLADGGGICISSTAYDQIGKKLALGYEYLGEQTVKNIEKPIRVYKVLTDPEAAGKVIGEEIPKPGKWPRVAIATVVILIIVVGVLAVWNFYFRRPSIEPASVEKTAFSLPDKPSVAVLPFKNLSGDPEQEYFSDGVTNDIITDLSKFRELFVIASNTVFTYKGKRVKVKDVGRELGVRYVLEGSVQKAREKVRINAQLIDATTGHHLWAERYDRELKDLFAVQNEIIQTIVTTLAVEIGVAERARVMHKDTESLEAYDYLLRGWHYYYRFTHSAIREAREMFKKAIELDPSYAEAYVGLAAFHLGLSLMGWTEFPHKALQQAEELVQKALSLDPSNPHAHEVLGTVYLYRTQYDLATTELQRAIELNPNDARSYRMLGRVMLYIGRTDDAIHSLETALRFDPNTDVYMNLGLAFYLKGRYDDSIRTLKRGVSRKPDLVWNHIALAAAYAQSGRSKEASRAATTVLRLHPFFEVDSFGSLFRNPEDRARIAKGLRKAGLK